MHAAIDSNCLVVIQTHDMNTKILRFESFHLGAPTTWSHLTNFVSLWQLDHASLHADKEDLLA
jgi:hypothetical protein